MELATYLGAKGDLAQAEQIYASSTLRDTVEAKAQRSQSLSMNYQYKEAAALARECVAQAERERGPVQSKIRVPLFATRTLNATGQSRVTLSLRQ